MESVRKYAFGVGLCFLIAAFSWLAQSTGIDIFGAAICSIFLGIVLGNIVNLPKSFDAGIQLSSKKGLQGSIILLGFGMNIGQIILTGGQALVVMSVTLVVAFLAAFLAGQWLGVKRNTTILIGVGTAICGGSAIAAAATVIDAADEEVSHSISTIFLFNVIAVFVFPVLGNLLGLSQYGFGVWAGTAVNDTSSVVAAASAYGQDALLTATIVKLTRTLLIIPVTLGLAVFVASEGKGKFRLRKVFPMFVLGFLVTSAICTVLPNYVPIYQGLTALGKFMIAMAMAAIGLKTNIRSLIQHGTKPILLGMICWGSLAAASLLTQYFLGIL